MESVLPVCRICLNESKDHIDLQARFKCNDHYSQDAGNEINYLQCLRLCTNLPIEENAGPQCICAGCEKELHIVYKFIQKAQSAQAILEESWQNNNFSDETFEHTEISIEKFDSLQNEGYSSDDLNKVEGLIDNNYKLTSDCTQLSNICQENSSSSCAEFIKDLEEFSIDLCDEYNNIDEIDNTTEEVLLTDSEADDCFHEIEYLQEDSKTLQENTHIFIPKKYKCHICNRFYKTENHLKMHLYYHKRRDATGEPYNCKICGELFTLQRYLTQHMIEHQGCRETYKCQYCDKEYGSKTALISHKRIHQAEALNCNECGKQFNGSYEFSVHLRFHKREKEKGRNKCDICCKEFSSSRYLSQHMTVHLEDKETYQCNYCNKKYCSETALNNHTSLHEGQPTKCNVCTKEFKRNCELKVHMRFHIREHPFKCTLCGKEFTIREHLRAHMWQHKRTKVECSDCGKLFRSSNALNKHSFSHSQKPYSCEFCNKAYLSRQKYKIHLQKAHSERIEIDLSTIGTKTTSNH